MCNDEQHQDNERPPQNVWGDSEIQHDTITKEMKEEEKKDN